MTVLTVRHTVGDYTAWKAGFDDHDAARKAHGSTGDQVLQSIDDPNDVLVLLEFGTLADAKAFAGDAARKQAMSAAGVVTAPEISFRHRAGEVAS